MRDAFVLLAAAFVVSVATPCWAQTAHGVAVANAPQFRLLRSVAGSKGTEKNGVFNIEDPRSTFYLPADTKVIIYFEWEGPAGKHHLEGFWKNPEGKVTTMSDFDYEAKDRRFAAYWELALPDSAEQGMWTMEARVDGELAGTQSFQVIAADRPALPVNTRAVLSLSEEFERAVAATVAIEKLDGSGQSLSEGSGFLLKGGQLLTAFQNVDGGTGVMARTVGGQRIPLTSVAAWNRSQDWIVFNVQIPGQPLVPSPTQAMVGDRAVTLNTNANGTRSIVDASITGVQKLGERGEVLSIASSVSQKAIGAPVLNEYGEVLGMIAGIRFPGLRTVPAMSLGNAFPGNLATSVFMSENGSAVPFSSVNLNPGAPARAFADLVQQQIVLPPISNLVYIGRATIAKKVDVSSGFPMPFDEKFSYTAADRMVHVFVLWEPKEKRKGMSQIRVISAGNQVMIQSKPAKVNFRPGRSSSSDWELPLNVLTAGIYRVEVVLDGTPVWRSFFELQQ